MLSRKARRKALELARAERENSKYRLDQAKKLTEQINKIKDENHFADAIIEQVLRGRQA